MSPKPETRQRFFPYTIISYLNWISHVSFRITAKRPIHQETRSCPIPLSRKTMFVTPELKRLPDSVADPDPDPHVFGPPGSGSTSQIWIRILLWIRILPSACKNSKENLDSYYFVTLFEFLSLKNYVNVASKSNEQKKLC
jgi:hypothetical protein